VEKKLYGGAGRGYGGGGRICLIHDYKQSPRQIFTFYFLEQTVYMFMVKSIEFRRQTINCFSKLQSSFTNNRIKKTKEWTN